MKLIKVFPEKIVIILFSNIQSLHIVITVKSLLDTWLKELEITNNHIMQI